MTRLRYLAMALVCAIVAVVALGAPAPRAEGQTVPLPLPQLPPLPPPPDDGSIISDLLGPASNDGCDSVAVVFALAGPIASAQLPPAARELVDQITPYLSLATYACGFLISPPSGRVCAGDEQIAEVVKGLNLSQLGAPVNTPKVAQIAYDTAAGIERAFLRFGVDIGQDLSLQIAEALGCSIPEVPALPPAAAPPAFPGSGGVAGSPDATSFVSVGLPSAELPSLTDVGGSRTIPAVTRTGPSRYPVDGLATVLLALPLIALAVGAVAGPRLRTRLRRAA
jgi:hypothetical protein